MDKVMLRLLLLLLVANFMPLPVSAQGLFAVINPGGDRQSAVLTPSSGNLRALGSPVGGEPVSTSGSSEAIDRSGNRLFLVGTPNGDPTKLFVLSTITGAVLASPNVSGAGNGIVFEDWDGGESKLFALLSVGSGDRQLATVNIATGAVTTLGSPLAGGGLSTGGAHALDPTGNRFFFVGAPGASPDALYSINTTNGAEISSPNLPATILAVRNLAWDAGENLLFGLFSTPTGEAQLGTINIATGAVSLRGNPIVTGNLSTFGAALDESSDLLFIAGQPQAGSRTVYAIDTASGIEADSQLMSGVANDILALLIDPGPLFADGFGSQNLSAWSFSQP
ncbi:MAG: hypothetical protein ABIV06_14790 [Thermoanaerobaculia bacterium]